MFYGSRRMKSKTTLAGSGYRTSAAAMIFYCMFAVFRLRPYWAVSCRSHAMTTSVSRWCDPHVFAENRAESHQAREA